jgi:hypothetical protein
MSISPFLKEVQTCPKQGHTYLDPNPEPNMTTTATVCLLNLLSILILLEESNLIIGPPIESQGYIPRDEAHTDGRHGLEKGENKHRGQDPLGLQVRHQPPPSGVFRDEVGKLSLSYFGSGFTIGQGLQILIVTHLLRFERIPILLLVCLMGVTSQLELPHDFHILRLALHGLLDPLRRLDIDKLICLLDCGQSMGYHDYC